MNKYASGGKTEKKTAGGRSEAILLVSENRKARFDYVVLETIESGIELLGSEVKSIRTGNVQLKDAYIVIKSGEAYIQGVHISPYKASSYLNHEPERTRRLLLNKIQIQRLERSIAEKGFSCVPLKLYFKGRWAKLEIGLVKGKNQGDKRDSIKTRDIEREIRQARRK